MIIIESFDQLHKYPLLTANDIANCDDFEMNLKSISTSKVMEDVSSDSGQI